MTRLLHPPERGFHRRSDEFDPVLEGARYQLTRELSLAIWARVCADATDTFGRRDQEQAQRQFYDLAARFAARGDRLRPDVGRLTRVETEILGVDMEPTVAEQLAVRVPGRDTQVAQDLRRRAARDRTMGIGPAITGPPSELPSASEVAQAMAALQVQTATAPSDEAPVAGEGLWPRSAAEPSRPRDPGVLSFTTVVAQQIAVAAGLRASTVAQPPRRMSALFGGTARVTTNEAPPARLAARPQASQTQDVPRELLKQVLAIVAHSSPGVPLPGDLATRMRAELGDQAAAAGQAVEQVRVHTDDAAAQAAELIGAHAFTLGQHVYFARGQFAPGTDQGDRLLRHELTHVAQYARGELAAHGQLELVAESSTTEVEARAAEARPAQPSQPSLQARQSAAPAVPPAIGEPALAAPPAVAGPIARALDRGGTTTTAGTAKSSSPSVTRPRPGINKAGFIDNDDGANIRSDPAEAGGQKVQDSPLPPATRVFVSGTHPDAPQWWYVTAYLADKSMVRGYVQDFRVTTKLPEPMAKLHQVVMGDTAEGLAKQEYGASVRDGHDLRYYENVLLYVNKQENRAGITGSYQDPNIRGGGSNNVQLVEGHRIWLVSPAYAKELESFVPDGSLTGGAIAKVKRFLPAPLIDTMRSVIESPDHSREVLGEYAQAILQHQAEIFGIVLGFLVAELSSAILAMVPGGQIAAAIIQLVLAAYGAAQAIQAAVEALKHASQWLRLAWTAQGNAKQISEASKEFLRMLVSIAAAALSYLGVKGNFGNAVKLVNSMPPGAVPALAVAGRGTMGQGGAGTAVAAGPSTGSLGAFASQMSEHNESGGGNKEDGRVGALDESGPKIPAGLDKQLTKLVKDVIQRARNGKLLKSGNYHAHFDDANVLQILKDADAIYQSEGKAGRLIFRKGNDIVVVEGPGSSQGRVITGYGPSGIKGDSGAAALGGAASDAGAPITDAMIKNGTIPVPQGRPPIPKAGQIAP